MALLNFEALTRLAIGLLPVFFFLAALVFLDSYKLVRLRFIVFSILAGCGVAAVCYFVNTGLQDLLSLDNQALRRYEAPLVEEAFKAAFVMVLIRTHRVGFLVDAAIHGFAVGAGFALIENIYYWQALPDTGVLAWIVRGFGTAILHGGATAIYGIVTKHLLDRAPDRAFLPLLPGLAAAVVIHAAYNHFILPPVVSTVVLVFALPFLMLSVFQESEKYTRDWLGVGFDTDQELLQLLLTEGVADTRVGQYLLSLRSRFSGDVVVDMLCWLRIHLELSIKAKGLLLMRQAGFDVQRDQGVEAQFAELRYLEKSIGKTGLLAIAPFIHTSSRELWQLHMLGKR